MVGIEDILNHSDESDESKISGAEDPSKHSFSKQVKSRRLTSIPDGERQRESNSWPRKIPKSKINKKHLANKRMVQISIRRKSNRKTLLSETASGISKLHFKYLEAGLRVKLTMAPSIFALYNSLVPHTNKRQMYNMVDGRSVRYDISEDDEKGTAGSVTGRSMSSKALQLIDNNLVDLAGYSNKVLLAFSHKKDHESNDLTTHLPTFNSLDTAVSSLFGISEYTLVRVTRSTSSDQEGSVLLKLETAKPGDYSLIDDEEFADEMIRSIGNADDTPNNLFIKKIVARPRYKSDMKIFLIPYSYNASLYVDERMFERDLINDVVNIDLHPTRKRIFCIFNFDHILSLYKNLLSLTKMEEESHINEEVTSKENSSKDNNYVRDSS